MRGERGREGASLASAEIQHSQRLLSSVYLQHTHTHTHGQQLRASHLSIISNLLSQDGQSRFFLFSRLLSPLFLSVCFFFIQMETFSLQYFYFSVALKPAETTQIQIQLYLNIVCYNFESWRDSPADGGMWKRGGEGRCEGKRGEEQHQHW